MHKRTNWLFALFLGCGVVLLWWLAQRVSYRAAWQSLQAVGGWGFISLALVNVIIIVLMATRWWLFLQALGASIGILRVTLYRLAGYSISYLTPGPQFGGEPLQLVLSQRHASKTAALTALVLDRIYDLTASLLILILSFGIALATGFSIQIANAGWLTVLLIGPLLYLMLLLRGYQPLHWVQSKRPHWRWVKTAAESEAQLQALQRHNQRVVRLATLVTLLTWLAQIGEYWLMLHLLGATLAWQDLFTALAAVRVAFLLPMPGALGTLEAGQIWVMQQLGIAPTIGLAAATLIRARDITLAIIGLICVGVFVNRNPLQ